MMRQGSGRRMAGGLVALMLIGAPLSGAAQPVPVQAVAPDAGGIVAVLHLNDLMPVLRDEAVAQAGDVADSLFQPGSAGGWADTVRRIHDPARMVRILETGVAGALPPSDPRIGAALDFYATPLGQRLLALELSARRALLAPGGDEAARAAFDQADGQGAPRVDAIRALIDRADLIEPNVAGALNAALAFSRGFAEGGGYPGQVAEEHLLAMVAQQEPDIRAETTIWIESYLLLAYSGLSDDELDRYSAFATAAEGRALAAVLFEGFDAMFSQTAYEMGLAAAGQLTGQRL